MDLTRDQVLAHRVRVHQLDRPAGSGTVADTAVLNAGVQDTGPDGARWALAVRGLDVAWEALVIVWSLRAAPHAYRRSDIADVVASTSPFSLRGFDNDPKAALDEVAAAVRAVVATGRPKGEVSGAISAMLPEKFNRQCAACGVVHVFELPFRFGTTHAGVELTAGTSPPLLRPIPRWAGPAPDPDPRFDQVRVALHFTGPSSVRQVAEFLDTTVQQVAAHWPDDAEEVQVDGEPRFALAADLPELADATATDQTRLLGPFDLFLQTRDRELLVPDATRRKDVWRTLGRPGAILHGHEIVGTWRPRASGRKLRLAADLWTPVPHDALDEQAQRLAEFRGLRFDGWLTTEGA